jgi:hypothetical protein
MVAILPFHRYEREYRVRGVLLATRDYRCCSVHGPDVTDADHDEIDVDITMPGRDPSYALTYVASIVTMDCGYTTWIWRGSPEVEQVTP